MAAVVTDAPPRGGAAKLSVEGLGVSFGNARTGETLSVIDDISFAVREREFVAIVGPSGCGKTTLLHCLAGLHAATRGRILCNGAAIAPGGHALAMVFQSPTLLPWRTVADNIAYGLMLQKRYDDAGRARVAALIELVGLAGFAGHYPHELSGGMQQRVNLARALAVEPEILLMDEPFAALDAQTRESMQSELLRIWDADRKTVVFITHQIDEAVYLADRVVVLQARPSRVRADMTIALDRPREPRIKRSPRFNEYVDRIADLVMSSGGADQRP